MRVRWPVEKYLGPEVNLNPIRDRYFVVQRQSRALVRNGASRLWLVILTYDHQGNVENGEILVQLKATDHPRWIAQGRFLACRIQRADLHAWLHEPWPVVLVLYDARTDTAFWSYVQQYFEQLPEFDPNRGAGAVTVKIPRTNVVNAAAIEHFAQCRDRLLAQMRGLQHGHDE
jgi:hypothetical protein